MWYDCEVHYKGQLKGLSERKCSMDVGLGDSYCVVDCWSLRKPGPTQDVAHCVSLQVYQVSGGRDTHLSIFISQELCLAPGKCLINVY